MTTPAAPCPVGGLVPWQGGIWPIVWRGPHPVLQWVYTIHAKPANAALHIHWNVSQADIVQAMADVARYAPRQQLRFPRGAQRIVLARKWSFERGCFFYQLGGTGARRTLQLPEDELHQRLQG